MQKTKGSEKLKLREAKLPCDVTVHSTCVYCTRVHAHHQTSDNEEAEIHDLRSAARSSRASSSSSSRSSTASSPRGVDSNDERDSLGRQEGDSVCVCTAGWQRCTRWAGLMVTAPPTNRKRRRPTSQTADENTGHQWKRPTELHGAAAKQHLAFLWECPPLASIGLYILPGNHRAGNCGRQRRFSDWNEQDLWSLAATERRGAVPHIVRSFCPFPVRISSRRT